jgi:Tfp pilus assembly protein PilE
MNKKKEIVFTKLEIIMVVVIMAVLGWITWGQFGLAKAKSRDVERRASLHEFSKIIKLYYTDYKELPSPDLVNSLWGKKWNDDGYVYIKVVPKENYLDKEYCYKVYNEDTFALLADLENKRNEDCHEELIECDGKHYCFEDKMSIETKKE